MPELGRWLTRDPIEEDGSKIFRKETYKGSADINLYGFVGGNPVILTDPLGLWVRLCGRKLNGINKPPVEPHGNTLRHDYLSVSNSILSFQAGKNGPGGGIVWSDGQVDRQNEHPINPKCEMVCDDPNFDQYVLDAAVQVGAPKYNIIAYPGIFTYFLGARNCQTWAREVLQKAKKEYLKIENCPKCFIVSHGDEMIAP